MRHRRFYGTLHPFRLRRQFNRSSFCDVANGRVIGVIWVNIIRSLNRYCILRIVQGNGLFRIFRC